jgi:hypothetical protein
MIGDDRGAHKNIIFNKKGLRHPSFPSSEVPPRRDEGQAVKVSVQRLPKSCVKITVAGLLFRYK